MVTKKVRKLILQIIAGIVGIWLTKELIEGVIFTGSLENLLIIGITLGLINFFIKPILDLIALPLRILTLGLFGFLINAGIVWTIDIIFKELNIVGLFPLLWTTLIIWIISIIASRL